MLDSFSEGSCQKTTMSRRENRRTLRAKEREKFDKEMRDFLKSY